LLHDQNSDATWIPLQHIADSQPRVQVIDSVLSEEEAVMGFEYGLRHHRAEFAGAVGRRSTATSPTAAQVIIDQFISSGEAKWGALLRAGVLLLPHGYEGAGPEHSSARLERFLQLCAGKNNMQVCVPSTPAQMFHMLRRQMRQSFRKPLIVMTPKSLLRHELSVSSLEDLSGGGFARVIGEIDDVPAQQVQRIVFCSGKVYFDLLQARRKEALRDVALVRIEQALSLPERRVSGDAQPLPQRAARSLWCQEEPQKSGRLVPDPSSPAGAGDGTPTGVIRWPWAVRGAGDGYHQEIHEIEQQTLVAAALHATTTEESARETTRLTAAPVVPAPTAASAPPAAPVPATPIRRRS